MIIHQVLQSSPEWHALRLGIPTASAFERLVTPKGNPSGKSTQEKYLLELLSERITGFPSHDFMSKAMERGKTLESSAVQFYELQRDVETQPVGFVSNDACTIGASPDRFVGSDGQMQIKVPTAANHLGFLLGYGSTYEEHKVQVQGELWVTGRNFNDVVSYNDVMPMALSRIERDQPFISIMEQIILEFSDKLETKAKELAEKGWMPKERAQNAEPVFSKETDLAYQAWASGQSN
jgi:hypothetical protein